MKASRTTRSVPAGIFKNACLRLMDEVSKQGVPLTVTKRGKPLVQIVPVGDETHRPDLRGTIVHQDEDIFSTGEKWDADKK
jgi:prevent-host-death family protein